MGFKVGMPILELKMSKKAASKCKKGGDARSVCCEAGEERFSKTKNFDPSRSRNNGHLGAYASGIEAHEHILEEVAKAEEIHRTKDAHGRGFRSDFTIAYALIVKPHGDWANAQEPGRLDEFFDAAVGVLDELGVVPKNEIVMRERHRDEGYSGEEPCEHEHIVFMAHQKDGDLVGSRHITRSTFSKLNREFPKRMRELGFECDELVDEERLAEREAYKKMTPAEQEAWREKRRAEGKRHGLDANAYIDRRRREKAVADAEKAIEIAKDATALADAAEARKEKAERDARFREKAREEMRVDMDATWEKKTQAEADAKAAKAERKEAEDARDAAAEELAEMEPRIKAVSKRETDVSARESSVTTRESAVAEREQGIAAKKAEADAAKRAAEAAAKRIEDEAEHRAEKTEKAAAERAAKMLDEAERLSEVEDKTESFLRYARGQMDRGDYYALRKLYEQWQAESQAGADERSRRTARLRSQVGEIQRRGRRDGGLGY